MPILLPSLVFLCLPSTFLRPGFPFDLFVAVLWLFFWPSLGFPLPSWVHDGLRRDMLNNRPMPIVFSIVSRSYMPIVLPTVGFTLRDCIQARSVGPDVCKKVMAGYCGTSFSKPRRQGFMSMVDLHPFAFELQPVWSIHMSA